jgi:hypothetical protein
VNEHQPAADLASAQLEAAEADLNRVRESLAAAGRGEVDATELINALRAYLDQHGPAFRSAAAAVGEDVRRQLLEQLYSWRTQLDEQLGSSRRPQPEKQSGGS